MSKFRVLITAPYFTPVAAQFEDRFRAHNIEPVVLPVNERAEESELLEVIAGFDGIICGDDRVTRRVLQQATNLKVICKWGTGIDSIDQEACAEFGVAVRNTPDAFSVPVADSVLAYALAFARNIPWMDRAIKNGIWEKIPGRSLSESTFGIIGVGNVGRRVAERASAFGCRLLGADLEPIDSFVRSATGIKQVTLEELLRESDFISLNCDLNPTSRHLINAERLTEMRETAVLINTSRGPVVNEDDLIKALQTRQIAGAGLDVFEDEPLPEDSPLRKMDNVLLAPHNSNSSPTAWDRVHENTFNNLVTALNAYAREPQALEA